MKKILAILLIFSILTLASCTQKPDETDEPVIVDKDTETDITDDDEAEETEKEDYSEDEEKTPAPEDNNSSEVDTTVTPDNNEPDEKEETPEPEPEQQPEEDPVIYDDSNATPASSFEYRVDKPNNKVHIQKFIGNEKDVVIPNYIDGYPVKSIGIAGFSNTSVESIVISENIEEIQPNAFSGSNLKNVTVKSKSIVFVGGAFDQCPSLESITFMYEQAEFIGPIYHECANLKEVIFLCNAPKCDDNSYVFVDHNKAVIKYKRGTNGWGDIQKLINEGWDRALIEIE